MVFRSSQQLSTYGLLLGLGMVTSASLVHLASVQAQDSATATANTSFPDTQNYWGQPFVQALAERNIVTGYPDNTYRPEQPVDRDEFASILQAAFFQPAERKLQSGTVYKDIPKGYWAASAIEEAYEMGFMKGYPEGDFRPNQPVTKTEVLVSLARNLNLPQVTNQPTSVQATGASVATPQQPITRRRNKRPWMFPLAMTTLMQPLMAKPAQATATNVPSANQPQPTASSVSPQGENSLSVSDYYQDAAQIPPYAVDDVAKTTAAGIVVNHPDPQMLKPREPASRGEVAALVHQALVYQGKINPISADKTAANYIVSR